MRPSRRPEIRALLRTRHDGLTAKEIATELGLSYHSAVHALGRMPDVYIDRWLEVRNTFAAVYVVVDVPADCPHPRGLYTNKVEHKHDIRQKEAVRRYAQKVEATQSYPA